MRSELDSIRDLLNSSDPKDAFKQATEFWQNSPHSHSFTPREQAFLGSMLCQDKAHHAAGVQLTKESDKNASGDIDSFWASDLGIAWILSGNIDRAIDWLEYTVTKPDADALAYSRLASAYLLSNKYEAAEENYQEAIRLEPARAEWYYNLAASLTRQNRLEEALEAYQETTRLNPDFKAADTARQRLLQSIDRADELVQELEANFDSETSSLEDRIKLANAYYQNREVAKAVNVINDALINVDEVDDESREDQLRLRQILIRFFSDPPRPFYKAAAIYQASQLAENPAPFLAEYAVEVYELDRKEDAENRMNQALEQDSDNLRVKMAHADYLAKQDDYDAAINELLPLAEKYTGHAPLFSELGRLYMWIGELEDARYWFDKAAAINPQALGQMVEFREIPEDEKSIETMKQIADNRLLPNMARANMNFALSRIYEKQKYFDATFERLKIANDRVCQTITYHPAQFTRRVNFQIKVVNKKYFERLQPIRKSKRTPIFVVGMPRSGTTLTEQILCSHPDIFGAGELPYLNMIATRFPRVLGVKNVYPVCLWKSTPYYRERAAVHYWNNVDEHDKESPLVVDKMPHNFMHLGLIASIFPNARIIHVNRDPRDNAVSNFQQNFAARHGGMGFAFDLKNIALQINDYHRVMNHWRNVLPLPIFDLSYEEMVEDMEGTARKLLDFVGVDWHDDVKKFYETKRAVRTASVTQVRQPIYKTSMKKWKRYEEHLGELLENLNPEVTEPWDNPTEDNNPYESKIVHKGEVTSLSKNNVA